MGRDVTDTLRAGDRAPDFTLPSSAGPPISLAGYRDKASVLLVFLRGTI
jgi:peroxiredoxin